MKRVFSALTALFLLLGLPLSAETIAFAEITATPVQEEPLLPRLMDFVSLPQDGGGYIVAGCLPRRENAANDPDTGVVYQVNGQGAELWRLEMEADFSLFYRDLIPLSDGSVAVLGTSEEAITGRGRKDAVLIIKDGKLLSNTTLTPGNDAIWAGLLPAREGFFVFQGEGKEKDRHGGTFHIPVLEKHRNDGSLAWRHVFSEHELDLSGEIEVEGGYLLYGVIEEQKTGKRLNEGVAVRITEDGAVQWITPVGDPSGGISFSGAALTPDGGVLLTGSYLPTKQPKIGLLASPVAACLDLDGTLRWQQIYGDMGVETSGFGAVIAVDNGYLTLWGETDYRPPLHVLLLGEDGVIQEILTLDTEAARAADRAWIESAGGKPLLLFIEPREGVAGEGDQTQLLHVLEIGL